MAQFSLQFDVERDERDAGAPATDLGGIFTITYGRLPLTFVGVFSVNWHAVCLQDTGHGIGIT